MPKESIKGEIKIEQKEIAKARSKIKDILAFKKEIEKTFKKEISALLDIALLGAIELDASDLHLEPEKEKIKMRLRIDGLLHDAVFLLPELFDKVLSRIKLLSGVKLNITDQAQDGRFSILLPDATVEVRVATLPSEYGEAVVMRLLNPKHLLEIEHLGMREDLQQVFKKEIQKPNGMIIATGPTGCGKTTTLYAILKKIQKPEVKIITIEDPIEYHLEGISQTQVNPEKEYSLAEELQGAIKGRTTTRKKYDFATGLEAIVRQDPDVILVGEIRDYATAKIALQAALTGHLVLTTLHTNDAAGTVARLQALGESPINIAPAIRLAIGQRLIRKVCSQCSKKVKATNKEVAFFKKELVALKKKIKMPPLDQNLKIPRIKGCKHCNLTGYKGRVGIYEFFLIDSEMENFILKSPSIANLRKFAEQKGMLTMKKDGLLKVLQGKSTLEEIERVCG